MRLDCAIRAILAAMPERIFVSANGLISRWAWQLRSKDNVVPMLGSMGLGQAIAIGMCIAKPTRPVGILNGDGNLLMEPSATLLAGSRPNMNLAHFCLNNGAYLSTGGQPTLARPGLLSDLAKVAGYGTVAVINDLIELKNFCDQPHDGLVFCEVLVDPQISSEPRRVEVACAGITTQVRRQLEGRDDGN